MQSERVSRTYRSRRRWLRAQCREVQAVRGVDLTVGNGELSGLPGPNGAGRTTTIKLLNTSLIPAAGLTPTPDLDCWSFFLPIRG
jgi:ABC-type multidrug transport system ATPase subunit